MTSPKYSDYIYAGIIEHSSNTVYYAVRGQGAWGFNGTETKRICVSRATSLERATTGIYIDINFDKIYGTNVLTNIASKLGGVGWACTGSSAIHYADLASGAVSAVIECTRKDNLEIAAAFPLIAEAGGVMVDGDGISLVRHKYLRFGQKEHVLTIAASSSEVAAMLLDRINSNEG